MELGQYQLQVFISLIVILAAACVALICDFLKGNNEQLRELNIELKVRREEEHRRIRMLLPDDPAAEQRERKRPAPEAAAVMARAEQLASVPSEIVPEIPEEEEDEPPIVIEPVRRKRDWGAVLNSGRNSPPPRPSLLKPRHAVELTPSPVSLPNGFQDGFVLTQLVQSHRPVSGLVVSIGVTAASPIPADVTSLIQTLLGPGDFAAQASEEEFLLIFPSERGPAAQRRLNQISQKLWDFQLASLGTYEILFSCGGVEVRSEAIAEAIASANERMQETRRGRRILAIESREANLRQAV